MGKKAQAAKARRRKGQEDGGGENVELEGELAALGLSDATPKAEQKKKGLTLSKAQKREREFQKQMDRMKEYDDERIRTATEPGSEEEEAEEEVEEAQAPGSDTRGLRNLGNTCFFNSVLQNLAHLEAVQKSLVLPPSPPTSGNLLACFRTVCKGVRSAPTKKNKGSAVNPKELLREITKRSPMFKGNEQQDAHELLRFLLDGLQNEYKNHTTPQAAKRGEEQVEQGVRDPVSEAFEGKLSSSIVCQSCLTVSHTEESFLDLSLPIPCDEAKRARERAAEKAKGGTGGGGGGGRLTKQQRKSLRQTSRRGQTSKDRHAAATAALMGEGEEEEVGVAEAIAASVEEAPKAEGAPEEEAPSQEEEDKAHAASPQEASEQGKEESASSPPPSDTEPAVPGKRDKQQQRDAARRQLSPDYPSSPAGEVDLYSCLKAFSRTEELTGEDAFICEACNRPNSGEGAPSNPAPEEKEKEGEEVEEEEVRGGAAGALKRNDAWKQLRVVDSPR